MYRGGKHFREAFGVSSSTLRRWAERLDVRVLRHPGGKRVYHVSDIARVIGADQTSDRQSEGNGGEVQGAGVIYARVSSAKQRDDLKRQIDELQQAYPHHRVFRDVASGVNFKRPGLRALLDLVDQGVVREVVVMHRDRLARLASDLLEWLLERKACKLVVHRQSGHAISDTQELAEDLLAVTTVFVASHHGKRAAEGRRRRREDTSSEETQIGKKPREARVQASSSTQNSSLPEHGSTNDTNAVVRCHATGIQHSRRD